VPSEEELLNVFDMYDVNGDGNVTMAEIILALKRSGRSLPQNQLERLVKEADRDESGTGFSFSEPI
tara:strand:+ start:666 stop:863 length:198 start_codon:yes stop_codon:yes gene_type:complete